MKLEGETPRGRKRKEKCHPTHKESLTMEQKISICGSRASAKGRQLSAKQSFLVGDIIAWFSSPDLLALPTQATYTTTCHGCFRLIHQIDPTEERPESFLKPCTGCRGAWYCSKECQRTDWRAGHKIECQLVKRLAAMSGNPQQGEGRILPTSTRALLRIVANEAKWLEATKKLVGNEERWREDKQAWADMELQGRMVRSILGADPKWVGKGEDVVARYASLLCKISTNSFNVTDLDLGNDSIFLDTTLAMANHSCIPNASAQIFGKKAILVAERPIAKDEEITISYIGLPLTPRTPPLYVMSAHKSRSVASSFSQTEKLVKLSLLLHLSPMYRRPNGISSLHRESRP